MTEPQFFESVCSCAMWLRLQNFHVRTLLDTKTKIDSATPHNQTHIPSASSQFLTSGIYISTRSSVECLLMDLAVVYTMTIQFVPNRVMVEGYSTLTPLKQSAAVLPSVVAPGPAEHYSLRHRRPNQCLSNQRAVSPQFSACTSW